MQPSLSPTVTAARRERALEAAAAVADRFARLRERAHLPGLAYGVVLDGELLLGGGCGELAAHGGRQPGIDSVFRIASMSKSFTAAAIVVLRDRGLLGLHDAISAHVPELAGLEGAGGDAAPITVQDLLTMSAGWPQDDAWADRQLHRDDAAMSALYAEGVSFSTPPATSYEYSNYGYMLLGRIISRVAGESALDFITRELLQPLAMHDSTWQWTAVDDLRRARGHRWEDDRWKPEQPLASGGDVAAFAGLHSSVRDLARWVSLFAGAWPPRDAPEHGPLSRASLREMQRMWRLQSSQLASPRLDVVPRARCDGYGYGLSMRREGGLDSAGHAGGLPGFGSHMRWAPAHGVGVIALANLTYAPVHEPCHAALADLVAALAGTTPGSAPPGVRASGQATPGGAQASGRPAPGGAPASGELLQARDGIDRLIAQWDDALAATLFADNVLLDRDAAHWRGTLDALRARHGALQPDGDIDAANRLRGSWRLRGERGACRVWTTLSPTRPPRVQTLAIDSILAAEGRLAEALAAVVAALECGDGAALAGWLGDDGPGDEPAALTRCLALTRVHCGGAPLRAVEVLLGDAEQLVRVRLDGPRAAVVLTLRLDAAGRLEELTVEYPPD